MHHVLVNECGEKMDEFLATIINSTVGKAAEKITEVLLSKPWARDLDEGKVILEQLNDPLGRENYLRKHVLPSLKMRTLHNADYDIFLDDIYYPLTVEVASNKDKVVIKDGVTLPFHGIVNIVGIAGQWKSTILRKLFSEEIKKSERMPFFIELRRVKNANIIAYLADILNSFGVGCSEDSLKILLQSQRVVLMLDGFDEVKHEERTMMMNEIKNIHYHFNTPIIATTRPNTDICYTTDVYNIFIDKLNISDKICILHSLSKNDRFSSSDASFKVLADLLCDKEELEGTICNPILVTLLYYCYPYMNDIPNNIIEFYRSLFDTLYARHDKIKVYTREKKSNIIGEKAKLCFSAICYNALIEEKFEFWGEELLRYAEDAIETEGYLKEDASNFIDDLIEITCLIQPEGNNRYVFLHKSVQEFYAAFAVANLPIEYKKDIYENLMVAIKCSEQLDNFMLFLHSLDSKAFIDEITIKASRDMGVVDVANMTRERVENVFDSALSRVFIKGNSTSNDSVISLHYDFVLGSLLGIDILPIMSGKERVPMTEIDLIFDDLFSCTMDKGELNLYKFEVKKQKNNIDTDVQTDDYLFPLVDYLKVRGFYGLMLDTYHQTIKDFYDRYYQPAYDSNLRRTLAMGRNFKLKKNN